MSLEGIYAFIRGRKRAYQLTFQLSQPANIAVLEDLAKFCRARESTFHQDPRIAANLDGRREVWLRITNHMGLTEEELVALYAGNQAGYKSGE